MRQDKERSIREQADLWKGTGVYWHVYFWWEECHILHSFRII